MKKFFVSLSLVFFSVGCTSLMSAVKPKDQVDPLKGYMYGQFAQNTEEAFVKLVIMNTVTKETDTIRLDNSKLFESAEKYGVHSILPGTYMINEVNISYFNQVGNVQYSYNNAKPFTDPVYSKPFEVKAGEKVYLGDFMATISISENKISWGLKTGSSYAVSTKEINEKYANIAGLPTREAFPSKK